MPRCGPEPLSSYLRPLTLWVPNAAGMQAWPGWLVRQQVLGMRIMAKQSGVLGVGAGCPCSAEPCYEPLARPSGRPSVLPRRRRAPAVAPSKYMTQSGGWSIQSWVLPPGACAPH